MVPKTYVYRESIIERSASGWYSTFMAGRGLLKADTLAGIKEMIRNTCIDCNSEIKSGGRKVKGWMVCADCIKWQGV